MNSSRSPAAAARIPRERSADRSALERNDAVVKKLSGFLVANLAAQSPQPERMSVTPVGKTASTSWRSPGIQPAKGSVMMGMPSGLDRPKNRGSRAPSDFFLFQQLPKRRVIDTANHRFRHFDRKMQIADPPSEDGSSGWIIAELNFQHLLRRLQNLVGSSCGAREGSPVGKRAIHGDSELSSALGETSPAQISQRRAIGHQRNELLTFGRRARFNRANKFQTGNAQNRK